MSTHRISLRQCEGNDTTAYLELKDYPNEPTPGIVAKTIDVHNFIDGYNGPALFIDLNAQGKPIGIEILYPDDE